MNITNIKDEFYSLINLSVYINEFKYFEGKAPCFQRCIPDYIYFNYDKNDIILTEYIYSDIITCDCKDCDTVLTLNLNETINNMYKKFKYFNYNNFKIYNINDIYILSLNAFLKHFINDINDDIIYSKLYVDRTIISLEKNLNVKCYNTDDLIDKIIYKHVIPVLQMNIKPAIKF